MSLAVRNRWWRSLCVVLALLVAPSVAPWLSDMPTRPGLARADDGDDGDDGGSGGAPAGGAAAGGAPSASGEAAGGIGDIRFAPALVPSAAAAAPAPPSEPETFVADELIALNPSPAALQRAQRLLGVQVIQRTRLARLGMEVVRLRLRGVDARTAREILSEQDPGVFELQHLFKPSQDRAAGAAPPEACAGAACEAQSLMRWPAMADRCGRGQTIGMVDTAVEGAHPALRGAQLRVQNFLPEGAPAAGTDHGTAVAAMLLGQPGSGYSGLVPQARLFAAAPFRALASGSVAADASGLAESLDWVVAQGARVVGLSLTGPDNAVLAAVVRRMVERGVVVVAAAGNGGPAGATAYPAAYPGVLAATAVAADGTAYRRANQGPHVDYALPGVNLLTVRRDGSVRSSSGTSYGVPFLVAMVSQSLQEAALSRTQWQSGQGVPVRDLGAPGRDPVFGWGLPVAPVRCR